MLSLMEQGDIFGLKKPNQNFPETKLHELKIDQTVYNNK